MEQVNISEENQQIKEAKEFQQQPEEKTQIALISQESELNEIKNTQDISPVRNYISIINKLTFLNNFYSWVKTKLQSVKNILILILIIIFQKKIQMEI